MHEGTEDPRGTPLFDFDGTLSLVRQGWMDVMTPMMVEVLRATGTGETPQQLHHMTREFVMELTGKQTVYQMIRLADEVRKRGGQPKDPLEYKQIYHDRLMERIAGRREALRSGDAAPQEMLVPYSMELLEELRRRDVALYVASGTDKRYVVEEVCLLGLDPYFGQHVYGAGRYQIVFEGDGDSANLERQPSRRGLTCRLRRWICGDPKREGGGWDGRGGSQR